MTTLTRRRFIAISAGLGASFALPAHATPMTEWRGVALGAQTTIRLRHKDAPRLIELARAEIERLEQIFSLYRPTSSLAQLNAQGSLDAPPFELLDLLALCGTLHHASAGLFDPTVQPLWSLYAQSYAQGSAPGAEALQTARALIGWQGVTLTPARISLARPGMALTLNGIAQGYIADKVTEVLRAQGLRDVLVDTGEMRALGGHPEGGDWPVHLVDSAGVEVGQIALRDMALASSSPRGTLFDGAGFGGAGTAGHILNPKTAQPSAQPWTLLSVTAPSAALADGLSTALSLMSKPEMPPCLTQFPTARLVALA